LQKTQLICPKMPEALQDGCRSERSMFIPDRLCYDSVEILPTFRFD
jgi:hypothetical protein